MHGLIRDIRFHAGLNLIVDETPAGIAKETGNNVGKTTVLVLVDYCLGGSGKDIYTDPENRKNEDLVVKGFLLDTDVLVTLTLTSELNDPKAQRLVIERNFQSRKNSVRRINGEQLTERDFEATLTNQLFPGHYGKKPTFPQIISHNIRYKEQSVTHTLRTLNQFTRDDEYETLYLFLLGCQFDEGDAKQNLLAQVRVETSFKDRLEGKQTRSGYEASLALLKRDIQELNSQKSLFYVNPDFEKDLAALDAVKYKVSVVSATIGRLKLRRSLIEEAVNEVSAGRAEIDATQLRALYKEVTDRLSGVQKTFEELVQFHNRMVDEKTKYLAKELPELTVQLEESEVHLGRLLQEERAIASRVEQSGSLHELEQIVVSLNEKHRRVGELETVIRQIYEVDDSLEKLNKSLGKIEEGLFSKEFSESIQEQLNKFNKHFAATSQELYGEQYALKVDPAVTKTGQKVYKFSSFNANFSSGKKQGEITCFDIAYTLFCDEERIPCYHFLLNDKKELMHDNQLVKIASLVQRKAKNVQFIASILRDKLPAELNDEKHFVARLSQNDKLFRIESTGKASP
jgi:uncharacterized protein YydD (DUF2326 family)